MLQPVSKDSWHTYPSMVAVVTSQWNGHVNVMASGWHTFMATQPGHYGIALRKETYTYDLIQKSQTFAVHFLPHEKAEWIQAAGTYSGRDMNKFDACQIPYQLSEICQVPIIKDAYFAYECRLVGQHTYGTHEWMVGEVVQSYESPKAFTDQHTVNFDHIGLPMYIGRSEYRVLDANASSVFHSLHNKKRPE
ncbi:flavin reductase family protein [Shouchella sp. JSM 1781072]|uniref:flavin reductase family protein n=1 Tax=Bacillaceae TaxID=186817 RepID=UPI0020D047FD|nr:flavin reductase family protein [Alkalihalobacillus sp. LMS6]UTR07263.1 flavin reductase family protein [Alkalihalobacillus sp. LMS6]